MNWRKRPLKNQLIGVTYRFYATRGLFTNKQLFSTSPNKEIQLRRFRHVTRMPEKNRWVKSCWLNPRENGPEMNHGKGGAIKSPNFAWSRLGVEPAELSEIAENCGVFRVPWGCCPFLPRGKAGMKVNESSNICSICIIICYSNSARSVHSNRLYSQTTFFCQQGPTSPPLDFWKTHSHHFHTLLECRAGTRAYVRKESVKHVPNVELHLLETFHMGR